MQVISKEETFILDHKLKPLLMFPFPLLEILTLIGSFVILIVGLRAKPRRYKLDYFPKVSVVSWFWKDGNIVERKIKNFLNLDYPNEFEIIIIDNHSKDETPEVCKKYAKRGLIKYYRTRKEYDRKAFGLDEAIKKVAKFDIIAMTDPDGVCEKDWLKKIVQPFKDPKVGAVMGMTHCGNFYENWFTKLRAVEDEWYYVIAPSGSVFKGDVHFVCGANYAIRKQALKDVGWHGKKTLIEDYETSIKLYNKGWEIKIVDANVWQEEVENLRQYRRQRIRWQGSGMELYSKYWRELMNILKTRPIGWFVFHTYHILPVISLASILLMVYGVFFNFWSLLAGLASFVMLNLGISIGLIKFKKRRFLLPYVPLYLLLEPFFASWCFFNVLWLKLRGKKVEWRSLYNHHYHRGVKLLMK